MDLADVLLITKDDGENKNNAKNAALEYKRALHLFPSMENGWVPQVSSCSAQENIGIIEILEIINQFDAQMIGNGWKIENRKHQNKYWLHLKEKEELGKKKYKKLVEEGRFTQFEKRLVEGKTINQILAGI